MFDTSWAETFVLAGLAVTLIGKKDLPVAAKFMGKQVGRVVGILQGVRAYVDKQAGKQTDLRALQDELRSGLREIDTVKSELAVAVSSQGLMGRNLAQRRNLPKVYTDTKNIDTKMPITGGSINTKPSSSTSTSKHVLSGKDYLDLARTSEDSTNSTTISNLELAPRSHCVAAIAEEEWEKKGIGFRSVAESGGSSSSRNEMNGDSKGSELLSEIIQQSLIHDQYDRVVKEQDEALQSKIDKIQNDRSRKT